MAGDCRQKLNSIHGTKRSARFRPQPMEWKGFNIEPTNKFTRIRFFFVRLWEEAHFLHSHSVKPSSWFVESNGWESTRLQYLSSRVLGCLFPDWGTNSTFTITWNLLLKDKGCINCDIAFYLPFWYARSQCDCVCVMERTNETNKILKWAREIRDKNMRNNK